MSSTTLPNPANGSFPSRSSRLSAGCTCTTPTKAHLVRTTQNWSSVDQLPQSPPRQTTRPSSWRPRALCLPSGSWTTTSSITSRWRRTTTTSHSFKVSTQRTSARCLPDSGAFSWNSRSMTSNLPGNLQQKWFMSTLCHATQSTQQQRLTFRFRNFSVSKLLPIF